jgi:hypothetical protein
MEKNPALQEKFLGPSPILDRTHAVVLEVYWMLRRGTPSGQGIQITLRDLQDYDPLLLKLITAGDGAFLEEVSKERDNTVRTAKNYRRGK